MQTKMKTLVWIKGLLLVTTTLVLFACSDPEVNDQQLVLVAREYLDQNKMREAAIELRNALQGNPGNAEARYLLGMINLDVGDTASAEKEFRRAADTGWSEEQARIGLARAMVNNRAFQKVLDEIEVKDSYSANARADLYALHSFAQAGLGDMKQARETLGKGSAIDANAFQVLKSTIQIQLAAGDIKNAGESLEHALTVYEENQEILLLSASVALRNKDKEGAVGVYKKVIALDPVKLVTIYGRMARLVLARLEVLDKNLDQAEFTLKPLFKRYANDPETNFIGGLLAFEQGKLDLAEQRLLTVLKVASDHAQTQLLFGTVSYAQQDYEQAAYYIARYVSVEPDNLGARKLLGRTYIKLGQHEEAQAALKPGLEEGGEDAELLALVGLSQLQSGDMASGIEGLEKAVKTAPESMALRRNLARAYISAGETESAIKELNAILRAEQYDQAINVVLDMFQKSPEDPAVLSLAGNVFAASNDRLEARKYFNRALHIKPDYVPATMLLARLEELDGHPAKAETLYKKLAEVNAEDVAPLMALARLSEAQNQTAEMLNWLEQARKRAPQNIKPLKILADYYLRKGQLETAGLMVKEAIKIAPRDNGLLVMQARWQMASGQSNKALSSLNALVTRAPDSVFARTMLGETYFKLDQQTDARKQLGIVLEKQAYYLPALMLMTKLELQSGHYDQVLLYAGQIQKVQPDMYMGYELAGDALMAKKDHVAAKASYEQAWQRKQLAGLAIKLAEVSMRSSKFEEATKPLLTWLSDHPNDARVLQSLGTAYQAMKQDGKAAEAFEKVLKIQPDNVIALNNLAWLYSLVNNPKALELAESAYRVNSNNNGILDTYGWILVQQGQVDKGRRVLERVMKNLPGVPEVKYHYAVALLKSGEEKEARKILGRLLKDGKSFEGREEAEQLLK
jgi:putative PEP-CTERM system TPR-repeat lipoprotein